MSTGTPSLERPKKKRHSENPNKLSHKRKRHEEVQDDLPSAVRSSKKKRQHDHQDTQDDVIFSTAPESQNDLAVTQQPTPPPNTSSSSPFCVQTTSFWLALSPIGQGTPLESLCAEHLSPLILKYYPPLKGVVLSYSNPRVSNFPSLTHDPEAQVLSRALDEYAVTYVWVTADFTLLKPERGVEIEGHVSVQSESHLGLVCWNMFNASIERKRLPRKWRWTGSSGIKDRRRQSGSDVGSSAQEEEEGYFVDANKDKVESAVKFRVRDFENLPDFGSRDRGFMSIAGTLLDAEDEARLVKSEQESAHAKAGTGEASGRSSRSAEYETLPRRSASVAA